MPYKSKVQARKFHAMLKRGEISAKTVRDFDKKTDFSRLPWRTKNESVEIRMNHILDALTRL